MHTSAAPWIATWLTAPLADCPAVAPEPIVSVMAPAITAYWRWHQEGGLRTLDRYARRVARDPDRAAEVVNDTYLDVRERVQGCVARAAAGRSLPTFASAEAVSRYHRIQARLRLQHRWVRRRRALLPLEGNVPPVVPAIEERVAVRRQALPLRFALCWTLADCPQRAAHKDARWWWAMLRHGLGLEAVADLRGGRNDPGEVLGRLQLRLAVSTGMRRWITAWAAGRPGWSGLRVDVPRAVPDHRAVAAALPALREQLGHTIAGLSLPPAEAACMARLLVRGGTVRGRLGGLSGDDPRARMRDLGAAVGAAVPAAVCRGDA